MRVLREELGTFVSNCGNAKQIKVIKITIQTPHTPLATGRITYINGKVEYKSSTGEDLIFIDNDTFTDINQVKYFRF